MDELARRSDRLVVMARKGAEILKETYGVPDRRSTSFPTASRTCPFADSSFYKEQFGVEGRKVLLTFGLLGAGQGHRVCHRGAAGHRPALSERHLPRARRDPSASRRPRGREPIGWAWRRLAEDRGVKDNVIFYNRFVSLEDLKEFIGATDIYLTPYLNEAQITSGTLAYVFGAGKAVVSTPYWHAQELLAEGRGDPRALPRLARHRAGRTAPSSTIPSGCGGTGDGLSDGAGNDLARGRAPIPRVLPARARRSRKANPRAAFAGWTLARRPYDLPPAPARPRRCA